MITSVIIDVDDTLCMSEAVCFELENTVLAAIGQPAQTRDIHKATWGQPLYEVIATRSPGTDPAQFREAMERILPQWVAEEKIDVITQPNIAALDALTQEGLKVYILTSRTQPEIIHFMEPTHTLAGRITAFYHRDNMSHHKPDPRAFNNLIAEHHLDPASCAYVGDSPSDAAAANAAGMHFVACFESGIRTPEDFSSHRVDQAIQSFAELPQAITYLNKALSTQTP